MIMNFYWQAAGAFLFTAILFLLTYLFVEKSKSLGDEVEDEQFEYQNHDSKKR